MADENKILDLDEALGEKKSVVIRRDGTEYRLRDLGDFSTFQLLRIQRMRRKISILQAGEDVTEEDAKELEVTLGEILQMLSDELPAALSYAEKTAILAFYFMEVRQKKTKPMM